MEKAIERAIVVINKEEESADDNCEIQDDVIDLDSDFEGVDERELMDVKVREGWRLSAGCGGGGGLSRGEV